MNNTILYGVIAIAIGLGLMAVVFNSQTADTNLANEPATTTNPQPGEADPVMCTADAMLCPDGSYVGRTGPNCEFVCPPPPAVPADVQAAITEKRDLIRVETPVPMAAVPYTFDVRGQARGPWYFEASFPIVVLNADGEEVATAVAQAEGEWMTEAFVPFSASIDLTDAAFTDRVIEPGSQGTLVFKKDNPSGLPENDDELRFPITFARE